MVLDGTFNSICNQQLGLRQYQSPTSLSGKVFKGREPQSMKFVYVLMISLLGGGGGGGGGCSYHSHEEDWEGVSLSEEGTANLGLEWLRLELHCDKIY